MVTATVIICTFNRHEMLKRAVSSVRAQTLRTGYAADIVVVDNSLDANARETVAALSVGQGLVVRYTSLPRPNISRARNAGVAEASADYVVFLDDDEWCELTWLDGMIATAESAGADLVFGAVLPVFPDGVPDWDPTGRSMERLMDMPSGSPISIHHDSAISGLWIGTCNSLLRRETCLTEPAPFDPALGLVGGEDYDLFLRLWQRKCRFVWCAEGVVWENVPGPRIRIAYRLKRAFTEGQQYSGITIRRARYPLATSAFVLFKGVVQLALVSAQWCVAKAVAVVVDGKEAVATLDLKLRMVAGKLCWWKLPLEPST